MKPHACRKRARLFDDTRSNTVFRIRRLIAENPVAEMGKSRR
jgi:hypothetical protein